MQDVNGVKPSTERSSSFLSALKGWEKQEIVSIYYILYMLFSPQRFYDRSLFSDYFFSTFSCALSSRIEDRTFKASRNS